MVLTQQQSQAEQTHLRFTGICVVSMKQQAEAGHLQLGVPSCQGLHDALQAQLGVPAAAGDQQPAGQ